MIREGAKKPKGGSVQNLGGGLHFPKKGGCTPTWKILVGVEMEDPKNGGMEMDDPKNGRGR